jgi:hypothetical protein
MSRSLNQRNRFAVFFANIAAFYALYVWATRHWYLTDGLETLWFGAAVAWWALSLLAAPFFRPPKDAVGAGVAAFIALAATSLDPHNHTFSFLSLLRNVGVGYSLFVTAAALVAAAVERKQYERLSRFSYLTAERLSSGAFLFGIVAFLSIFGGYTDSSVSIVLSVVWLFFALVRPFELILLLADQWRNETSSNAGDAIGEIIGVQSRNSYLAKLLAERVRIKRYDFVEFLDGSDTNATHPRPLHFSSSVCTSAGVTVNKGTSCS